MKTNDIYLCSFPKSGVTFFSFLFAAARLRFNGIAMKPTMYNIDYLVVDTHKMAGVPTGSVWRDGFGDLYKSHNPFFAVPNVIYVLRNPIDALRSYHHFRRQLGATDSALQFLGGPEGAGAWIRHVRSWLLDNRTATQSIFVTQYEDLLADPRGELRALGAQLGIEFDDATIEFAVEAARIERMRADEDAYARRNPVYAQFNLEFVRKGEARAAAEFTPQLIAAVEPHVMPVYEMARARIAARAGRGADAPAAGAPAAARVVALA
jgi:hypothetical protein